MSNCGVTDCLQPKASTEDENPASTMPLDGADTLLKTLYGHVEKNGDKRMMTQPVGGGECKYWTRSEALAEAKKMASYLKSLNLEPGSKIALCSKNCSWWLMADWAIWMAGYVTVPVYPTLTGDTVSHILEHSESKLLFVGKLDEAPWKEMVKGVPDDLPVVTFPLCPKDGRGEKWDEIVKDQEPIAEPMDCKPDDLATIIYTSGSTGRPKGVMHSFKTMFDTTSGLVKNINTTEKDRYMSYLPLAHGMERWSAECQSMHTGMELFFAETLKTFVVDLNRARPTLFLSVPRLWTKFQQGVSKKMPPSKLNMLLSIPIISTLVKKKILKGLGLECVRLAGAGSAPMPAELLAWYHRLGLELLEGYGMTENFNYSHMSRKGQGRVGYVGQPYDDVEQRIASDGEIQIKGPGNMLGYYKNEEATKETFTDDGWLRTGDKGTVDEKGRLKITGRTKEIFKTSKGKYVAPAPIENKLIVHGKVELACVGGVAHPQPHAVIQLNEDARAEATTQKGRDAISSSLESLLKSVNAAVDQHEQLEFLAVVKDEWLPENGFLTPTQKIVRNKIETAYKPEWDGWYASKKKVVWFGEW